MRIPICLLITTLILCVIMPVQGQNNSSETDGITKDTSKTERIFCPGDALKIISYPDTNAFPNGRYVINDSGYVIFPFIGPVNVSEKTEEELESFLSEEYINYLSNPDIQVKPLIRTSLIGGFLRPGLYWMDPGKNMWELIKKGGPPQRDDGFEELKWVRDTGVVKEDLTHLLQSGMSLSSQGFQSGDQIRVTNRERRRVLEILQGDVFPLITFILSTAASTATLYLTYQAMENNN